MTNDWTELHPDFAKKHWQNENKTWQQKWEEAGFTNATVQAWIALGFAPNDLWRVQEWTSLSFTPAEAGRWLTVGLRKDYDWAFAAWLRNHNYSLASIQTKLAILRTEYNQVWLTKRYPDRSIKWLDINRLAGPLNLSHYPQLEVLNCYENQLTNLDLTGCANLREIRCSYNQLTSLNFLATLPYPAKLTHLALRFNPLASTLDSLAALVNLEYLDLEKTKVHGSLAPLSQCRKLKTLYISNTQLASDLEHLPAQLETLWARGMPVLEKQMAGFSRDRDNNNRDRSPYLYQAWRITYDSDNWLKNQLSPKQKQSIIGLNVSKQNLHQIDLSDLPNLETLDCSNNPLLGNLQSLNIAYLEKLETLDISNTNFDSGLEFLPNNIKVLKCSGQIEEQLRKIGDPIEDNFAPLLKPWKKEFEILKEKQDKIIASAIPLERLFVVRGNLKQFASKWGKVAEQSKLDKLFLNCLRKSPVNELDQLSSPQEIGAHWYWNLPQWGSKITAGIGGVLAITYEPATIGGSIAAISPVIDVITTKMKESFYDEKEKKWQEFLTDADTFLDSYHELLGILSSIETKDLREGAVSSAFKNLKEAVDEFLTLYDKDGNQEIDVEELITNRELLVNDLKNHDSKKDKAPEPTNEETKIDIERKSSKLWAIINGIKALQEAIANHRKAEHYEESKEKENKQIQALQETNKEIVKTNQELVKKVEELTNVVNRQQKRQEELLSEIQALPKTN